MTIQILVSNVPFMDRFIRDQFKEIKQEFIDPLSPFQRVLDIGSRNVNGSLREFFENEEDIEYTGLDVVDGPGVDYNISKAPYDWAYAIGHGLLLKQDVIISSSTLEHVQYPWETMREIGSWLDEDGIAVIGVPSRGKVHNHPIDCWRFYPDSMQALADWAGLELVTTKQYKDTWNTFWGIFRHDNQTLIVI